MSGLADRNLADAAWLKEPETRKIMKTLGRESVRVVGGCVRDALRGKPVLDIDMATTRPPEEVLDSLAKAGFKVVPTGIEHGTVMAIGAQRHYEITTLREDVETDGRHAKVRFGQDWQADAERRDFTVNALYADMDGTIYDPLGTGVSSASGNARGAKTGEGAGGLADLEAGIVRFIGDADARIAEDYLRVLRFFRFSALLQPGAPDPEALAACSRAARQHDGLAALSGERIAQELFKLLGLANSPQALELMREAGVLGFVFPFADSLDIRPDRLRRLIHIEETQLFEPDAMLRLAALCPDNPEIIDPLSDRLRLSKKQTSRLKGALTADCRPVCYMSAREMRRNLYLHGRRAFIDRCFLHWVEDRKTKNAVQWRALIAMAQSWEKPVFPLTGDMMKAAGVPEGPEMGRVASDVENWWIDSDFTEDRFSIIERLKAVVQATIL